MNKQTPIVCEGVTKLTFSNGMISIDFSNKQSNKVPAAEGNFLTLNIPSQGFLHMAACIDQLVARMKECGYIINLSDIQQKKVVADPPATPVAKQVVTDATATQKKKTQKPAAKKTVVADKDEKAAKVVPVKSAKPAVADKDTKTAKTVRKKTERKSADKAK